MTQPGGSHAAPASSRAVCTGMNVAWFLGSKQIGVVIPGTVRPCPGSAVAGTHYDVVCDSGVRLHALSSRPARRADRPARRLKQPHRLRRRYSSVSDSGPAEGSLSRVADLGVWTRITRLPDASVDPARG